MALFIILLLALGLVLVRMSLLVVDVHGNSMSPTLRDRDRVVVFRLWPRRWLKVGQVVVSTVQAHPKVYDHKGEEYSSQSFLIIKRILGLPNDRIIKDAGNVLGLIPRDCRTDDDDGGIKVWNVPPGHCFLKSDGSGADSSLWGTLPLANIIGVLLVRLPYRDAEEVTPSVAAPDQE